MTSQFILFGTEFVTGICGRLWQMSKYMLALQRLILKSIKHFPNIGAPEGFPKLKPLQRKKRQESTSLSGKGLVGDRKRLYIVTHEVMFYKLLSESYISSLGVSWNKYRGTGKSSRNPRKWSEVPFSIIKPSLAQCQVAELLFSRELLLSMCL